MSDSNPSNMSTSNTSVPSTLCKLCEQCVYALGMKPTSILKSFFVLACPPYNTNYRIPERSTCVLDYEDLRFCFKSISEKVLIATPLTKPTILVIEGAWGPSVYVILLFLVDAVMQLAVQNREKRQAVSDLRLNMLQSLCK